MAARSKSRKRALDVLFEAEARDLEVLTFLDEKVAAGDPPVNEYAAHLVRGVQQHRDRIDELLSTYSQHWTLARMPAVDRNALRIGVFELLFSDDVPDAVAVSEAVNLVQDLSTDESPAFVNGVLGNILRDKDQLAV